MRKIFSLFAALTLSVGLWAQTSGTFAELQQLVDDATAGTTLTLDKDYTYEGESVYDYNDGGVKITKDLELNLNGHKIDGNNRSRCFLFTCTDEQNPITVTIKNGTIINGYTQYCGGAISIGLESSDWTVPYFVNATIDNCTISNNNSEEYTIDGYGYNGNGGGIFMALSTECTITNSILTNNNAVAGGGLSIFGTCTITGATFNENSASLVGGAIDNLGVCTIHSATFSNNEAQYGGAIQNDIDEITLNLTAAEGKSIVIENNKATDAEGGVSNWGTINMSGQVIIKDNYMETNTPSNFSPWADSRVNIIGNMTGSNIYFELVDVYDTFTYGTLTSGYSTKSGSTELDAFFHYDGPATIGSHNVGAALNADGEIYVGGIYTRDNLYDGKWGTICLGYAVPSLEDVTATFYKLNYYDGASSLYVTEVTELEAGKPYVFEAHAESFTVEYIPTDEPTPAETVNGLIGTLDGLTMEADAYALVNNMVVKAAAGTTVPANRAYIDLTQVSTEPLVTAGAPRRIGVASAPTGLELNNVQKKACKVLDKGQFVIIRDNKRFNAQGIEIQ